MSQVRLAMPPRMSRRPTRPAHPPAVLGLLFGLLAAPWLAAVGEEDRPSPWPLGRWRVVDRGWGLESRLRKVEVRPGSASGDAVVVAIEADDQGRERVWGSARLDR